MTRRPEPPADKDIPSYLPVMPAANPGARHRPQQPHTVPHREDIAARLPRRVTDDDVAASRPQPPDGAALAPSPVYPERPDDGRPAPVAASNQSAARYIAAPPSQGPRPGADVPATLTVVLGNATRTSQGSGPGVLTLPRAEAARMIGLGLASPAKET